MKDYKIKYFVNIEETEHGPFSFVELKGLIQDQIADPDTLVRQDGDVVWGKMKDVLKNEPQKIKKEEIESKIINNKGKWIQSAILVIALILIGVVYHATQNKIMKIENEYKNYFKNNEIKEINLNQYKKIIDSDIKILKDRLSAVEKNYDNLSKDIKIINEKYNKNTELTSNTQVALIKEFSDTVELKTKDFDKKYRDIESKLNLFTEFKKFDEDLNKSFIEFKKNTDQKILGLYSQNKEASENLSKVQVSLETNSESIKNISSTIKYMQEQIPGRRR